MPVKEVEIYSMDYLGMHEMSSLELLADIQARIAKVKGDFRQKEILDLWQSLLKDSHINYAVVKLMCKCSSGTYMRTLAQGLGKKLGVPALAYSIRRTAISS
jgi:tRNA U55 pseudouridine synthase TruB